MGQVTRQVVIPNRQGLHARPIAMIAEAAHRHRAALAVGVDGREVDGRSIMQLMTLCAAQGTEVTLRADGDDAEALVDDVASLIEGGFGEK
ncbi:MAG: HPr family phosphocarrier protein [Planctomycetota bacterium JB042]